MKAKPPRAWTARFLLGKKTHIQDQKPVLNLKLVEELSLKKQRGQKGERGLGRETMVFCTRFLATFFKQMYGTCRTLCRIACNHENVKKYLLNKRTYILQILYCRSFGFKLQIIFSRSEGFLRSLCTCVFTIRSQHNTMFLSPGWGLAELCFRARHLTLIVPLSNSDV